MAQSFKHRGLKLLWEESSTSKLPPELVIRIQRMLDVIDSAQQVPEDFGAYQNWNIHKLSGELKDY